MLEKNMNKNDQLLSKYACLNKEAIRLKSEKKDFRSDFFRDIDRIIYSLSYTRYIDKTQVFSNNDNDNISKRIIHVQLVSKIARTIGRALNLNEDLIEAAALGHDLGHVPFGHVGEKILNDISSKCGEGYFNHNIQSVRILKDIENSGEGSNVTLQVLDAIMCHNGLFPKGKYYPSKKNKEEFLNQYLNSYKSDKIIKKYVPMTLEGCVVRISDMIGYLGRDIEDAIRLGKFEKEDLPKEISNILGSNNHDIVDTIVMDLIKNSLDKSYLLLSPEIYDAIVNLKKFNNEKIYSKANTEEQIGKYKIMFESLFEKYLKDLKINNKKSEIYKVFLDYKNNNYKKNTNERIVIDFIAGMTDDYLINQYHKYFT